MRWLDFYLREGHMGNSKISIQILTTCLALVFATDALAQRMESHSPGNEHVNKISNTLTPPFAVASSELGVDKEVFLENGPHIACADNRVFGANETRGGRAARLKNVGNPCVDVREPDAFTASENQPQCHLIQVRGKLRSQKRNRPGC